MRILYATLYRSEFGIGGAEYVLRDLVRNMKEKFGEEVACAMNAGDLADFLRHTGIPVFEIPRSKIKTLQILARLNQVIATFRPDIIHSHHRYLTFLLDLFFKKRSKILHTQHVLTRDKRGLFRYGHLTTAVHESVRENLISHYGAPGHLVVTIPNAVRSRAPDPVELEKLQARYPRLPGQVIGLCIARMEEQKGHLYLIQAVDQLPDSHKRKIKIFLAGDGTLAPFLKQEAARRGLAEQFVFLGHTPQIPELLTLCDFVILASLWEGLPLSILEAYTTAKPVIATDIPGSKETVRQGETGLLVPPRNAGDLSRAIRHLMDHPVEAAAMGRKGYAFWEENFSFEKMLHAYHDLYREFSTRCS